MSSEIFYNKQSFERFSDNVCETLFSYLSISDKVKFECMPKQWQSLIFNNQKNIIINESYRGISNAIEFKLIFWDKNKISIIKCLNFKIFKTLISLK